MQQRPDVCFLDIRMPGLSGLEVAQALAEDWPDGEPFPLLVFITAYDQYARAGLRRAGGGLSGQAAADATAWRLACTRLHARLAERCTGRRAAAALEQLRALLAAAGAVASERLEVIQAAVGNTVHLVPIDEVIYFEAADKYLRVDHRRARASDPHVAARIAAAARSAALLASAPRHGGAGALDRQRAAPRIGQGDADACASAPST